MQRGLLKRRIVAVWRPVRSLDFRIVLRPPSDISGALDPLNSARAEATQLGHAVRGVVRRCGHGNLSLDGLAACKLARKAPAYVVKAEVNCLPWRTAPAQEMQVSQLESLIVADDGPGGDE